MSQLISVILDLLDRKGLLALRQGNKSLHALATRRAFQELTVTDTVDSSTPRPEFPANDLTGPGYDAKIAAVPSVISGLSKFPELAYLTFTFHDEFSEENWDTTDDPSYFLRQQSTVLAAAPRAPLPALKSLTLTNLIAMPNDLYESPAFAISLAA
ncbi:hypothetical protein B0H10DRAFT_2220137 [Mycena sp. CBHHK59/15]|nr:hypothetical protein B0H10DRAFT_2220137 [Mycena sp. CBHHK59/15]